MVTPLTVAEGPADSPSGLIHATRRLNRTPETERKPLRLDGTARLCLPDGRYRRCCSRCVRWKKATRSLIAEASQVAPPNPASVVTPTPIRTGRQRYAAAGRPMPAATKLRRGAREGRGSSSAAASCAAVSRSHCSLMPATCALPTTPTTLRGTRLNGVTLSKLQRSIAAAKAQARRAAARGEIPIALTRSRAPSSSRGRVSRRAP